MLHAKVQGHSDATLAVVDAITALEVGLIWLFTNASQRLSICLMSKNSPITNAGVGSSIHLHGRVECDASVMNGMKHFGAVGALSGLQE